MAFLAFAASTGPYIKVEHEPIFVVVTCLGLNFIYLLLETSEKSDWRIFRLIRLWFDAKESELRQRAKPSQEGK